LAEETWYSPDELSAIEFQTLATREVRAFAEAEKLDENTTDRLVEMAEEEWERQAKAAANAERPDWSARGAAVAGAFIDRAKGVLTAEQLERLKEKAACGLGGNRP